MKKISIAAEVIVEMLPVIRLHLSRCEYSALRKLENDLDHKIREHGYERGVVYGLEKVKTIRASALSIILLVKEGKK